MSAYIVSDNHIHSIVSYTKIVLKEVYYNNKSLSLTGVWEAAENTNRLGQILINANYLSINERYIHKEGYPEKPHKYAFKETPLLSPIEVIKACHCLDYQSCESDDWEHSDANQIIQNIIYNTSKKLDGYNQAAWGIE